MAKIAIVCHSGYGHTAKQAQAGDFKKFADASSKPWSAQAWKDKIAGGFTNSASLNGDKYNTLMYFVTLQHLRGRA
jgi:NAD(P)H dehydrogenase (quinone)